MSKLIKNKQQSAERGASSADQSQPEIRRLNLKLTSEAYGALSAAARRKGCSMTELIRWGIALIIVALDAAREGKKLAVIAEEGRVVKELLLPN